MELNLQQINRELEEIECKYTTKSVKKCPRIPVALHANLEVLSKEFDSLGLPTINVSNTLTEILHEVLTNSRDLVQIHRNTLGMIKQKNIDTVSHHQRHQELKQQINDYKRSVNDLEEKCLSIKKHTNKLALEITDLKKKEFSYKEEIRKLRSAQIKKDELSEKNIKKLQLEIQKLKEMCGQDLNSKKSTNEIALQLLKKYKVNEKVYKSTIKTLQQNNEGLLNEVLNVKEELILTKANYYKED
ncbi:hypothetical protein ABEB36_000761 [Hypothenemus hampei]|uniref:Uncharacterized protein n=1 Tax=Hypothenemus hampei TaxID=57062 RepID=A0ABD1FCB8_HYPHA